MAECEHKFCYRGLEYFDEGSMPGTGALNREYYDVYFCEKCLTLETQRGPVGRWNSYQEPLLNSTPLRSELRRKLRDY